MDSFSPRLKKMTLLGMFSAIAWVVMAVCRFPIVPAVGFLTYEPKDVVIIIAGFLFGPLSSFLVSLVVSLVEMVTVSDTGLIGLIMNVISTCSFACLAAYIYKKKQSICGAVIGLSAGVLAMTGIMLLWNYLITPFYLGVPREAVVEMLLPGFLPFNLIKGGLNAALTLLIYKPVRLALHKARLLPERERAGQHGKINLGVLFTAALLLVTLIFLVLVLLGIL